MRRNCRFLCMPSLLLAFALWAFGPSHVHAQTVSTGAIAGAVTDPSAAAIPSVSITATEKATASKRVVQTDSSGVYRFNLLPPGEYELRFEAAGFKTVVPPTLSVTVTETRTLNVQMILGEAKETVEVSATAQVVQSENATLGTVADSRTITEIPLSTRNYTQILTMSTGVVADVSNAANLGNGTQDFYVNGASNTSNNFQMDGSDVNNFGSGRAGSFLQQGGIPIPNPDAIQEFKIQTSLYDAGYGRGAGANVEVVTKTGTNQLHGAVFEFLRNDKLDANDFFLNQQHQPRAVMKQNQFGGSLGGPVIKDKFFLFGSYQGTRQVNGLSAGSLSQNSLPPLTNDRSAATLGAEFCGQKGAEGGVAVACDGSNINPVASKLLNMKIPNGTYLIPTPQTITNGQGFSAYSIPGHFTEDQFLINADYVISPKNRLTERYFFAKAPQSIPFSQCFFNTPCTPGSGQDAQFQNHVASLKLASLLSNSLVNEVQVSYSRNRGLLNSESKITDQSLGITPGDPTFPKMPTIAVNGLFSIGGNFNDDSDSTVNQYQYSDQLAWTRGRHTVRGGFEFERAQFDFNDPGPRRGILDILSFPDFLLGLSAAQNGTQFSNIFLSEGIAGSLSKAYRANNYASFVQDDFKVNSRLTINLGLRWEINGGVSEDQGRFSSVFPSLAKASNPQVSAGGTLEGWVVPSNFPLPIPTGVTKLSGKTLARNGAPLHNLGPRLGFAWRPLPSSSRLVLRGGYGVFYTRTNGNSVLQTVTSPPFVSFGVGAGGGNSLATFEAPFNPPPAPAIFPTRTLTSGLSADYVAENYDSPMVQQYNLETQYEFLPRTVLEVGYVGSRGTRLASSRLTNTALLASPTDPVNGITTNTVANAGLRVPILGFAPNGLTSIESYGFSMYNGLQVTVRRQLSHGIQFQGAYTWGKNLTDVEGVGFQSVFLGGDGNSNDPSDRHQRWGPADFDRQQRFVLTYLWEIPRPRGENLVNRRLLGGWTLSGVSIFQSGLPVTVTDPSGGTIYGSGSTSRAELCPGFTQGQVATSGGVEARLNNYFNKTAFCAPPTIGDGTGYGDTGRAAFRGPHQANFDMGLIKTTKVGGLSEAATLEFRADFYNAFNHPQFANPGFILGTPSFGQIQATSVAPRLIQFGLKYSF
ncbi:MAG: TonB-dependent receptor [Candidatus Acidiferrum sp.]